MGRFLTQSSERILKAPLATAIVALATTSANGLGPTAEVTRHDIIDGVEVVKLAATDMPGAPGRWRLELTIAALAPAAPEIAAATGTVPTPGAVIEERVFDPNRGKAYTTYTLTQIAPNKTAVMAQSDVRFALVPGITEPLWRANLESMLDRVTDGIKAAQRMTPQQRQDLAESAGLA
jgi:hypothetical protein